MDWIQMGAALGSLLGGVFGTLSFIFLIWPIPQIKDRRERAKQSAVPFRPTMPKLVAIPVGASLVLSLVTLYALWHRQKPFEYPLNIKHMERVDCMLDPGHKYTIGETFDIDGKEFTHCGFDNSKLMFHGDAPFAFEDNRFGGSITLTTDHRPITAFVELMNSLGMIKSDGVVVGEDGSGHVIVTRQPTSSGPIKDVIPAH
jgi:hypothetical protein